MRYTRRVLNRSVVVEAPEFETAYTVMEEVEAEIADLRYRRRRGTRLGQINPQDIADCAARVESRWIGVSINVHR